MSAWVLETLEVQAEHLRKPSNTDLLDSLPLVTPAVHPPDSAIDRCCAMENPSSQQSNLPKTYLTPYADLLGCFLGQSFVCRICCVPRIEGPPHAH